MRALVLYYAYDGNPEMADPIAIIPLEVWVNVGDDEVRRMFGLVQDVYDAPEGHCREAWVEMPSGNHLFETPDLGDARMDGASNAS